MMQNKEQTWKMEPTWPPQLWRMEQHSLQKMIENKVENLNAYKLALFELINFIVTPKITLLIKASYPQQNQPNLKQHPTTPAKSTQKREKHHVAP